MDQIATIGHKSEEMMNQLRCEELVRNVFE